MDSHIICILCRYFGLGHDGEHIVPTEDEL